MARIRSIKPEFWKSETIAGLDMDVRLTFIGLWSYVDDNGVGRANERLITSELYPLDDPSESLARISRSLARLSAAGLVTIYEAAGKRWIYVNSWEEHQKVDKPNRARYPTPVEAGAHLTCVETPSPLPREDPATAPLDPAESSRLDLGIREQRSRGTRDQEREASANAAPDEPASLPAKVSGRPARRSTTKPRTEIIEICDHLADRVEGLGVKRPLVGKRWHEAARLLVDHDEFTLAEIHYLIDWATAHHFWHKNIHSLPTLRKHRDRLKIEAKAEAEQRRNGGHANGANGHAPRPSTTDQRVAAGLALAAQFAEREGVATPTLALGGTP